MISPSRARELAAQAERLYDELVQAHPSPRAARVAVVYAHTLNRILEYRIERLAKAAGRETPNAR
jgi:hypothetical protein